VSTPEYPESTPSELNALGRVAYRPSWQADAVDGYLASTTRRTKPLPPASSYNRTGRAYPDVAARAVAFAIMLKGAETSVDGTSGACEYP
jgi:tripeptidyl-peptidase-1